MRLKVEHRLRDILAAGENIHEFVAGLSFEEYLRSKLARAGVERELITIGEALNAALQMDPTLHDRINEARDIVDFRNMLVHGYGRIEDDRVWGAIHDKLPLLLSQVRALLPPAP